MSATFSGSYIHTPDDFPDASRVTFKCLMHNVIFSREFSSYSSRVSIKLPLSCSYRICKSCTTLKLFCKKNYKIIFLQDFDKTLQEIISATFFFKKLLQDFCILQEKFHHSARLTRYVKDLSWSLARKILARLAYFLKDAWFY